MTRPELVDFRKELIQTAAVCAAIIEDIDFGIADYDRPYSDKEYSRQGTSVIMEISAERYRQDEKWGPQHHSWSDWLSILGEEFGEACTEYNDNLLVPFTEKPVSMPSPIQWGKRAPAQYGRPTTARLGDPNVQTMAQLFDDAERKRDYRQRAADQQATVQRQQDEFFDKNEGRFDREDD